MITLGTMRFSVHTLIQSRTFVGLVLVFAGANAWSWVRHQFWPACCDQEVTIGFPVPFHISGGITGSAEFFLLGLLLDVVVALTVAVTLTWAVRLFRHWKDD